MSTINKKYSDAIKAIGEKLIEQADEITKDLDGVRTITINSEIEYGSIINYDITKNYGVGYVGEKDFEIINYKKEGKDEKDI